MEESIRKRKKRRPSPSHSNPVNGSNKPEPTQPFLGHTIKDLRMRRVFTPDFNSLVHQNQHHHEEEEEKPPVDEEQLDKSESVGISGNGSNFKTKMGLNRCGRRKVFKNSSSFSYKRLLPYLMDIANDDSSVTKIEIVDAAIPCKLHKLDVVKSKMMPVAEKIFSAKVKGVALEFDVIQPSETEDVQKLNTEVHFNQQGNELDQITEFIRPPEVKKKVCESNANRVDASVKEEEEERDTVQMTPPDPGIFTNTEDCHGGEFSEAKCALGERQICKDSGQSNDDVLRHRLYSKRGTNSINRTVLDPCSRLRLFKNPRSLSYRRLLPYLIDISKTNSSESWVTQHSMPPADLKEDTAEQNYVNKINTENSSEKQPTEDPRPNSLSSISPLSPLDGLPSDANNNPVSSMPQSSFINNSSCVEQSLVTSETLPKPLMLIDLQTEDMSHCRKLEPSFNGEKNSSSSPSSSTTNNDILSQKNTSREPGPPGKQKNCLNMGSELNNNEVSIGKFKLNQNPFQVAASDALVSPSNAPFRGILKRNRRGCRGLCNCLNCASFRLHAERAFEFSHNQMHDAEEVSSDLINELAKLRLLLEKSIISDNDLAGINPVVIKQACNKALETENLAKERLRQLNFDLNIHCKIPTLLQPKVTFANYIQERTILLSDPSASTERTR